MGPIIEDDLHRAAASQEDPRGFTAKVSDFGLSQLQPDKTPSTGATPAAAAEPAGTVAYMAPEMLCYGSCSPACDVYAFGVLGQRPWPVASQLPSSGLGLSCSC